MFENFITEVEINFIVKTVFALISGVAIGIERESRLKDAGISTNTLVIMGAVVFATLSEIVDPASKSRIAAQVVTGIGFLGAGLIMKQAKSVKNLTTAASIWFSGAIGLAIGYSFYFIGIIATICAVLIPRIPHIYRKSPEAQEYKEKE